MSTSTPRIHPTRGARGLLSAGVQCVQRERRPSLRIGVPTALLVAAVSSFSTLDTAAYAQSTPKELFATGDECFSKLQSVMNPNTKWAGVEVYMVGCLSATDMGLTAADIPYNLPYDYDYHRYWENTNTFFTQSKESVAVTASTTIPATTTTNAPQTTTTSPDGTSSSSGGPSTTTMYSSTSAPSSTPASFTPPIGDPSINNYYNDSIIRGYQFSGRVSWLQPSHYPTIPTAIQNSPNTAANSYMGSERDSCAAYCNQRYIEQSTYTPVAASTDVIRFVLAYGRCTCLGPRTNSWVQIGDARTPECCQPMPATPNTKRTSSSIIGGSSFPNVEAMFAPQPAACQRFESYGVVYQLSLTCPINASYCDYKLGTCAEKSVTSEGKRCCLPLGAVSIDSDSSSMTGVIDETVMQWMMAAVGIIIASQFVYWFIYARKRAQEQHAVREDNGGADTEYIDANGNLVRIEGGRADGGGGGGVASLAQRLIFGNGEGDVGGLSEELAQDDVVGRLPTWQELERELTLRNRVAARQGLEIVLIPGHHNGLPVSVVIKGRGAEEKDVAAAEAMRLLAPVCPTQLTDDELCCPICTDELKEEVLGVKTKANHFANSLSTKSGSGGTLAAGAVRSGSVDSIVIDHGGGGNVTAVDDAMLGTPRLVGGRNDDVELTEMPPANRNRPAAPTTTTTNGRNGSIALSTADSVDIDDFSDIDGVGNKEKAAQLNSTSTPHLHSTTESDNPEETSNVVILACKHLIHRECMHEYISHVVKSYLAPITCPLCRGIVVLQNLAAEQEILKRSLLEFRFLVESELLRLIQLGASALPLPPPPPPPVDGSLPPPRPLARIVLANGADAPIRTNRQMTLLLRDEQFEFGELPVPMAPIPPAPLIDYDDDDGDSDDGRGGGVRNGRNSASNGRSGGRNRSNSNRAGRDDDPFATLTPLRLQQGGHRRDRIPLGPGMRSRPSRREVVSLRVALVARLKQQLEHTYILSHTRAPSFITDDQPSNPHHENHHEEDNYIINNHSSNGRRDHNESYSTAATTTDRQLREDSVGTNNTVGGGGGVENQQRAATPAAGNNNSLVSHQQVANVSFGGGVPGGYTDRNNGGSGGGGGGFNNASFSNASIVSQHANYAPHAASQLLQISFSRRPVTTLSASVTPVTGPMHMPTANEVGAHNGGGGLTNGSFSVADVNLGTLGGGRYSTNNGSVGNTPVLTVPARNGHLHTQQMEAITLGAPAAQRGGSGAPTASSRGDSTESQQNQHAANNTGSTQPLVVNPSALSRGLSRPTRVVRKRGVSMRRGAGRGGGAGDTAAVAVGVGATNDSAPSAIQAIVDLPARAAAAVGSALGIRPSRGQDGEGLITPTLRPRPAPIRLRNDYDTHNIAGLDGPLPSPRAEDYEHAEADAAGIYEELRGSPSSPNTYNNATNHGSSSPIGMPASPNAITDHDGRPIQRVIAPPPQPRRQDAAGGTTTTGGGTGGGRTTKVRRNTSMSVGAPSAGANVGGEVGNTTTSTFSPAPARQLFDQQPNNTTAGATGGSYRPPEHRPLLGVGGHEQQPILREPSFDDDL